MAVIKLLILSDTHDSAFPETYPEPILKPFPEAFSALFSEPQKLPTVDVVLHCGDLTMIGGLSNYRQAIKQLAAS